MLPLERPTVINFITSFRKPRILSSFTPKNCNIYLKNTRSKGGHSSFRHNAHFRMSATLKRDKGKNDSVLSFLFLPLYFRFILTFFLETIAAPEFFIDGIILAESF